MSEGDPKGAQEHPSASRISPDGQSSRDAYTGAVSYLHCALDRLFHGDTLLTLTDGLKKQAHAAVRTIGRGGGTTGVGNIA